MTITLDRAARVVGFSWRADGELLNVGQLPEEIRVARQEFTKKIAAVIARGQAFAGAPRVEDLGRDERTMATWLGLEVMPGTN